MMHDKPAARVTGANQGTGLQIAKDFVAHGLIVLVGSRNLGRGEAAAKEVGPGRPEPGCNSALRSDVNPTTPKQIGPSRRR
jgi:NAD(P)-dependent dehydrogenase (short-subunit alcohol dehydrogenase family)